MGIREVIEERKKLPDTDLVTVEGMKEKVLMRRLSANTLLKLKEEDPHEIRGIAMIVACVLDEQGKPVFSEAAEVRKLDWAFVSPLMDAAVALNSPAVEEAGKNLKALPS